MHFYELHEGDGDVFVDLLVVRDDEMEPDEFFQLVQSIRRRVLDTYEHDTLVGAIAAELEREHGFFVVSDDRLVAAVNVSRDEDDNFLAEIDPAVGEIDQDGEFRTAYADFDPSVRDRSN